MLNRLYIVVGVLAILLLAAAFIVPRIIPWGNYRDRMESLAADALGTEVKINGDIHFTLLPAPHLSLGNVSVGPPEQPVLSVASAEADFSLMDFLRDRYSMTRLVLDHPVLDLRVGKDGSLETPLTFAGGAGKTSVSASAARIAVGTIRVTDQRSGKAYSVEGVDGDLSIAAIGGPFAFHGGGTLGDRHYGFQATSSALDARGNAQVSVALRPDSGAFSLNVDGALATGASPHFSGDLAYRQSPVGKNPNGVIGDLTFAGKLDATSAKLDVGAFTLIPDENRAETRLTGTASVDLGAAPSFAATLSGGALALPPRDATAEAGPQPYELVRMLGELPPPPIAPLPGTIVASLDELNLRSFSLRNVRLDAATDGQQWTIRAASGQLPGGTTIKLAGDADATDGHPSFAGTLSLASERLEGLAALWRKPATNDPLFGMPGAFDAKVSLSGQNMALTDGQFTLDGTPHALTALVRFGATRRIDVSGQFSDLGPSQSAALLALLPDAVADQSAAMTFPQGAIALTAKSATVLGLSGHGLTLEGKWGDGELDLSRLAATDLGGAGLDFSLTLGGSIAAPQIGGGGKVKFAAGDNAALARVYDVLGTPAPVRALLSRSLPVDISFQLDKPADDGSQHALVIGKAGVADLTADAQLGGGLLNVLAAPLNLNLKLSSADARGLTAQLGLGDVSVLPETGPLQLTARLDGTPTGTLKTNLGLDGGGDSLVFDGAVTPGDLSAITGTGKVAAALSDSSVLAADFGIAGLSTPPVNGSADLKFTAPRSISLDTISGTSGAAKFSGRLGIDGTAKGAAVSGQLSIDSVDVAALTAAAAGPTALMASAGKTWPDGPIAIGDAPRATTGSIAVKAGAVTLGSKAFAGGTTFSLDWDATKIAVDNFEGALGGGTLKLSASLCCAGPATDKQLSGEAAVQGVALRALVPPAVAATLSGTLDGSVRFAGLGDSLDAVMEALSGDGSITVKGLRVQKFDPAAFAAIAATKDIIDLDPADLGSRVATALGRGSFAAPTLSGGFTIAGGLVRLPNLAAATPAARLFGGATLKLADLSLGGSFALTPVGTLDAAGLISETTSKVTANLSGTLLAPARALDIGPMVDAVKVKAYEIEVARLEALKAADDARAKAAANAAKEAAEDAALKQQSDAVAAEAASAAATARQAAAEAAAKQAAAAAADAAADAAARKAAREAAARPSPLDLQIPSQPFFTPLN